MSNLIKPKSNFTQVANTVITDKNLSLKAIALFVKMCNYPKGMSFSATNLTRLCKESKNTVNSGLQELEENGYLQRKKIASNGRIAGMNYILSWEPFTNFPYPKIEDTEKEDTENEDNNNKKTYKDKILNNKNINKATEKQINLIKLLNNKLNIDDKDKNYNELTKETASVVIDDLNDMIKRKEEERIYFE